MVVDTCSKSARRNNLMKEKVEVDKLTTLDLLVDNDIISRREYKDSRNYGRNGLLCCKYIFPNLLDFK